MSNESPQDVGVKGGLDPNLFGDGDFVQVRAALIRETGAVEAIILSRIHFRADESYRHAYEQDGEWWWRAPALNIAEETGLTEKQVKRALTSLRDRGLIVGEQHKREGNYDRAMSYRVNLSPIGPTGTMDKPQRADVHRPQRADVPSIEDLEDSSASGDDFVFELLWEAWPNKKGKKPALTKWSKFTAKQKAEVKPLLLGHAAAHAQYTELRFVPMLATWLNQERWTDPLPVDPAQQSRPAQAQAPRPFGQVHIPRGHRAVIDETGAIVGSEPKPGYGR